MRPVFLQIVGVLAIAAIIAIVYLNRKVDNLEAQIKKADAPKPRPLTNPTGVNTPFKPQNPSA